MIEITTQLYLVDRDQWRAWLETNYSSSNEIWLVIYKKHIDKPSILYEDAVEEALCFGWIDGIMKRIDDEKYVLRFSPRRKKSIWSEANKSRVRKMIKKGLMTDAGLVKVTEAKKNGEWDKAISSKDTLPVVPPDLKKALAANRKANENFSKFASSYKKQYIWWITSAKREATRAKRIRETVMRAEQNRKPGIE